VRNLLGQTLDDLPPPRPRQRQRRARPFDPNDVLTWQEVADLQPRFKERLRLGAWVGWHVRKQGDHAGWGDERRGARRAGIIEAVPSEAAFGVLDWYCVPTFGSYFGPDKARDTTPENVLWVELKTERGKLSEEQAAHGLRLARAGQEVAVLRPRHFMSDLGKPDLAFIRLAEHQRPSAWFDTLVQPEWTVAEVLHKL
jgi:hypothetical protein